MRKLFFLFLAALCALTAGAPAPPVPDEPIEIVSVAATEGNLQALAEMRADVLKAAAGRVHIVATAGDLGRLSARGVPFAIETARFAPARPVAISAAGGINGEFHSYRELESDLMALESAHPRTVKVLTIGMSLEGRHIYAVKISDAPERDEGEAGVLFLGCHHAREWISVEVPLLLARYLAENAESNPAVADLVARGEIWIVPLVNPDGLEYSIDVYRYWRKNRRANTDGSFGVDLNRNYGYMWGADDVGSSPSPLSETYRGPAAFSEPETRAVRDLFLGKDFRAVVSYHSYSQTILYPWGYADVPTDRDSLLREIGLEMAGLIEAVNGRAYACGRSAASLYLTNGDTTDWTFASSGIPSYTVELPPVDIEHGGFFNAGEEIDGVFRENLPAMLSLARRAVLSTGGPRIARREKYRRAVLSTERRDGTLTKPSQKYK
jgi:carboxypeptidase T